MTLLSSAIFASIATLALIAALQARRIEVKAAKRRVRRAIQQDKL
jgi:hypothetical protein